MKRVLSLLLSVVMLMSITAGIDLTALAQTSTEGICGDNLQWCYDSDTYTLTISGQGDMYDFSSKADVPWVGLRDEIDTIVVEEGVTSIGNLAFFCTIATEVRLPQGLKSIGSDAFEELCAQTIELPDTLEEIGDYAFGAGYLTELTIPASVSTIGVGAFANSSSLESVVFEENSCLSVIQEDVFTCCTELSSVILPDNVNEIQSGAFSECGLTEVNLPASLSKLDCDAFYNCTNLKAINVDDNNNYFKSVDGVLYTKDMKELLKFPEAVTGTFLIPKGVEIIEDYAFENSLIDEVVFSSTVKEIHSYAFAYSSKLYSVALNDGIQIIENGAFNNCPMLKTIYIPSSVTSISGSIFSKSNIIVFTESQYVADYCKKRSYTCNTQNGMITVSFDANGGTCDTPSIQAKYMSTYGELPVAQKNGYEFSGWYTSASGGTVVTSETSVNSASDITLYAHYIAQPVTVYFDANEGKCDTAYKVVSYNGTYGTLPTPERDGYTGSWYYNDTKVTGSTKVATMDDHTLVAKWTEKTYKIAYYDGSSNLSTSGLYTYTQNVTLKAAVTKTGYKFLGWAKASDATTPDYQAGQVVSKLATGGTIKLYAVWEDYPDIKADSVKTVNITNGGEVVYYKFIPLVSGTYMFTSAGSFDTSGYVCNNSMKVIASDSGNGNNFRVICKLTGGATYYLAAGLKNSYAIGSYTVNITKKTGATVRFDAGDGVAEFKSMQVAYGYNYGVLPKCSQNLTTFLGWFTEKNGGTKVEESTIVTASSNYTLYAHYAGLPYYVYYNTGTVGNVRYHGSSVHCYGEGSQLKTAEELGILNIKPGYHFIGWATTVGSTTVNYTDGQTVYDISQTGGGVNLYAVYAKDNISVNYISDGKCIRSENYESFPFRTIDISSTSSLKKTGYIFAGWSTSAEAKTVDYKGGEYVNEASVGGDFINLYAVWEKITYTLNLYNNDDELITSGKVAYDEYFLLPTAEELGISVADESCFGWAPNKNSNTIVYKGGSFVSKLTSNDNDIVNLYTVIKDLVCTVTFDANGGECDVESMDVTYGADNGEMPVPMREGYDFDGWYCDGEEYTSLDNITKDLTLEASWSRIRCTVYFDANGGTCPVSVSSCYYGTSYSALPVPVRDGYDFDGWFTGIYNGTRVTSSTIIKEDMHLYARWISNDKCAVYFDANGGVCEADSKEYVIGEPYGALPVPVRDDVEFFGWFDKKTGGNEITAETEVTGSRTIYAYWLYTEVPLVVTTNKTNYNIGDSFDKSSLKISFSTLNNIPASACKVEVPDMTTPGAKTVKVSFESDGIVVMGSVDIYVAAPEDYVNIRFHYGKMLSVVYPAITRQYVKGQPFGELPEIENEYFTANGVELSFYGWYDAETMGNRITEESIVPNEPTTYYANWLMNDAELEITDTKTEYLIGEEIEPGTLTVTYAMSGKLYDCDLDYCVISPVDTSTTGVKTVEVLYCDNEFIIRGSFEIKVVEEYSKPCAHEKTHTENEKMATCTESGYTGDAVCDDCGAIVYEGKATAPKGHGYDAVVTRPTCTEKGYTTYTCAICLDRYTADYTEPSGHDTTDVVTPATCTEHGYTTHTCKVCGNVSVDSYTDTRPHDYVGITIAPTCSTKGYVLYICSTCSTSYVDDFTDEVAHDFDAVVTPATCAAEGYTTYTCKVCGEVVVDDYTEALEHDYAEVVTAPTCSEYGYTTHTCKICGNVYIDSYTEKTNHYYRALIQPPTCTEHGYTTYACAICGDMYISDFTSATGHDYDAVVTPATCKTQGYTTYTCSECDDSYVSDFTDYAPHDFRRAVVAPTCTTEGYTSFVCNDCGYTFVGDKLAPTGHSYTEKINVTPATASSNGKTVTTNVCTVCGSNRTINTKTIARVSTIKVNAPSYVYTGKDIGPGVTVKDSNGVALKYRTDYKLTYQAGRVNVGTYSIVVTFMGNYSGTKTLYFDIVPKSTSISSVTAGNQSFTVNWYTQKVQTTGYQVQYSRYTDFSNSRILTFANTSSSSVTRTSMGSKVKYYIRVRTYKTVNGKTYYSAWSAVKQITTK